ncbi:PepSY domain-containing protein [Streptomyces ipomoeae]|uniref:PepSY domain-containing protein n=1 Tax=Streptomyces ipomoeae TaxID=103232 RepID=UPI0011461D8F|nr:PepSY domain-containing protein [Streptomyces ipomoeae]MDX2938136.1 PepSY domain-containing protein [Streptomyces ipomoeae]TQE31531.1 peptidase propeptide and YpeB domain protein [Streptomyces ipomoeae]
MKRNIVIATIAAAALIGGGTATAIAVSGDDEAQGKRSSVQVSDDDKGRDDDVEVADDKDDRDDADDRNDSVDDKAGTDGRDDDADDRAEDSAEAKAADVSAADAITAALKHKAGTAVSADLDDEGTNLVWDIDILTDGGAWHSVQIDPGTGKVLGSHADRDDDGDDAAETERIRAALKGSSVTAAEAAEAAAAKGTVTSVDLDEEGRDQAWEVDTTAADGTGNDWRVNLDSAKVTADHSDD